MSGEEIVYRGVAYAWLRSRAGKAAALVLSATLLALVHAGLGPSNVTLATAHNSVA